MLNYRAFPAILVVLIIMPYTAHSMRSDRELILKSTTAPVAVKDPDTVPRKITLENLKEISSVKKIRSLELRVDYKWNDKMITDSSMIQDFEKQLNSSKLETLILR